MMAEGGRFPLWQLPLDISMCLMREWVSDVRTFALLEIALCNRAQRPLLLASLRGYVLSSRAIFSQENEQGHLLFRWILSRGMLISWISLEVKDISSLMSSYLLSYPSLCKAITNVELTSYSRNDTVEASSSLFLHLPSLKSLSTALLSTHFSTESSEPSILRLLPDDYRMHHLRLQFQSRVLLPHDIFSSPTWTCLQSLALVHTSLSDTQLVHILQHLTQLQSLEIEQTDKAPATNLDAFLHSSGMKYSAEELSRIRISRHFIPSDHNETTERSLHLPHLQSLSLMRWWSGRNTAIDHMPHIGAQDEAPGMGVVI